MLHLDMSEVRILCQNNNVSVAASLMLHVSIHPATGDSWLAHHTSKIMEYDILVWLFTIYHIIQTSC